jgi:hypothetical protein
MFRVKNFFQRRSLSSTKRRLWERQLLHFTNCFYLHFSQFPFNKEQVRILLFRECDWRGRRLLFDSSAIEHVTNTTITTSTTTSTSTSSSVKGSPTNQSGSSNNSSSSGKPSPPKLDKNNVEYYEGKAYRVRSF